MTRFRALDVDGLEPAVALVRTAGECALAVRDEAQDDRDYFVIRYYSLAQDALVPLSTMHRVRLGAGTRAAVHQVEEPEQGGAVRVRSVEILSVTDSFVRLRDGTSELEFRASTSYGAGPSAIDRFGDAHHRRFFPRMLRVEDGWPAGQSGTLAEYPKPHGRTFRVLWVR
ncbi:MAG: hypothetical protein AAGE52_14470 [Myxococcota bacterium]